LNASDIGKMCSVNRIFNNGEVLCQVVVGVQFLV
jgi:hypothetical protein